MLAIWVNSVFSYVQVVLCVLCFPKGKSYTFYYFFTLIFLVTGPIYSIEKNLFGQEYTINRMFKLGIFYIIVILFYSIGIHLVLKQKYQIINLIVQSHEQKANLNLILDNLEESIIIAMKD